MHRLFDQAQVRRIYVTDFNMVLVEVDWHTVCIAFQCNHFSLTFTWTHSPSSVIETLKYGKLYSIIKL